MSRCRAQIVALVLIPALVVGCGNDISAPSGSSVRVVSGEGVTDTIEATLVEPLVVQVRGARGRLAAGAVVRFAPLQAEGDAPFVPVSAFVKRPDGAFWATAAVDTADAQGRASILVRLGTMAGRARILVAVNELGITDVATFTVLVGAARYVVAPADLAMFPGAVISVRSVVTDRRDNERTDPVSISVASGPVSLQGTTVTAQTVGIATIVSRSLALADTTTITVVPPGVLAVSIGQLGVGTVKLDGSDFRVVTPTPSAWVRWAPGGAAVSFDNGYARPARITTMTGATRRVREIAPVTEAEMHPVFSPDGGWVYLGATTASVFRLWRARADGTEAALLPMESREDDFYPSPSPDGTRLAYLRRSETSQHHIRILDLATGAVSRIDVPGHAPAWSPTGDLIAYVDAGAGAVLRVMKPDGTERRTVSSAAGYEMSVQWSPDARWLIAYNETAGRIQVVEVATGLVLPLVYSASMRSPSWKP